MSETKLTDAEIDEAAKLKLMLKETPMRRLVKKLLTFRDIVESDQRSVADAEKAHAQLMCEIDGFELTLQRAGDLCETYDRERAYFEGVAAERRARAEALREQLAAATARLEEEVAAAASRAECARLCDSVSQLRDTAKLREQIAELRSAIDRLQHDSEETQAKLEARTKQFRLLLQAVALITAETDQQPKPDVVMTTPDK